VAVERFGSMMTCCTVPDPLASTWKLTRESQQLGSSMLLK